MAFQTGSQLRPELSSVDYTPFLQAAGQAAQMQAQGIAQLGSVIGKGIDAYSQNKEREKQAAGIIKAADTMSSGFEPILEKVDPRIATALQDLRSRISDPSLSTLERASAAKAFMESAPNLLNAGVKYLDAQLNVQQRQDVQTAKVEEFNRKQRIADAARSVAVGKAMPSNLTPEEQNEAFISAATMREKGQMTYRTDINGVPTQVTKNLLTGEETTSQVRQPYMSVEDTLKLKSKEKLIDIGAEAVKAVQTEVDSASAQSDLAEQINDAMERGATTGPFAEASSSVKNLAESVFGGDYGATVQKLYVQGGKGLTSVQRRAIAKGLGTMSDDDRKDFDKGLMSINDPKQAVKYYVEVARLNKERADARQAFISQLLENGATLDVVQSELSKLKKQEPFISSVARQRVFGGQSAAAPVTTAAPQAPATVGGNILERLRAEQERRKAGNK